MAFYEKSLLQNKITEKEIRSIKEKYNDIINKSMVKL